MGGACEEVLCSVGFLTTRGAKRVVGGADPLLKGVEGSAESGAELRKGSAVLPWEGRLLLPNGGRGCLQDSVR